MKASHIFVWFTALAAVACTDGRVQPGTQSSPPPNQISSTGLVAVGPLSYHGVPIHPSRLQMSGSSLYVSGINIGLMRAEVSGNPESPATSFVQGEQYGTFTTPPLGAWTWDNYASGAIAIDGQLAITSGNFGTSLIDLTSLNLPHELSRYPGNGNSDEAFIYKAIVPNGNIYYGFRESDSVYTMGLNQVGNTLQVQELRQDYYSSNQAAVCCVTSATRFANNVLVAFTKNVVSFQIASNGQLINPTVIALQASYVTSTADRLYVQVTPIGANPPNPGGIYVYSAQGTKLNFYASSVPFDAFVVAPDNQHLYASINGQLVIYRMQ